MSTQTPSTAGPPHAHPLAVATTPREIKLISHSSLFYWWPVWAFGFFMAIWTAAENSRLAVVPADAKLSTVKAPDGSVSGYMLTTRGHLPRPLEHAVQITDRQATDVEHAFPARVSGHAWLGTLFIIVLVLTVVITNVPLRGLWSFITIMSIVVVALFISLFHGWEEIYDRVANLRVFINMAGYLFISTAVFVLWALATFVFDRRAYIVFTPGQLRVCEHIGASVKTYDTMGITLEKQRDDLFRHYILGFGSGDLIVKTAGAERQELVLHNILGIGWKLKPIEDMLREKATVVA